jgi:hypothetical protein
MKKFLFLFVMVITAMSCSNETENQDQGLTAKGSTNSTSNWGDYKIVTTVSLDGTLWTYTITRTNTKAKALSHFIIDLKNCGEESATFANIVWATVNGSPAVLSQTEGSGTNCNPQGTTNNFVKFDNIQSATSWVLVLKFDRGYETFTTAAGWIKAGTSCSQGVITAPGCPIEDYCSFSQGFFFANGVANNGADVFWTNGLTIGDVSYTQTQGNMAWNIDRGRGGDQTLNGFFQLGAVRLSGVENEVALDAELIDAYFTGINIFSTLVTTTGSNPYSYFNLPAISNGITKAQVIAAGGRIGSYIDANHCQ